MLSLHTWVYDEEAWERCCENCLLTQEHTVLGYSDYDNGVTWITKVSSNADLKFVHRNDSQQNDAAFAHCTVETISQ